MGTCCNNKLGDEDKTSECDPHEKQSMFPEGTNTTTGSYRIVPESELSDEEVPQQEAQNDEILTTITTVITCWDEVGYNDPIEIQYSLDTTLKTIHEQCFNKFAKSAIHFAAFEHTKLYLKWNERYEMDVDLPLGELLGAQCALFCIKVDHSFASLCPGCNGQGIVGYVVEKEQLMSWSLYNNGLQGALDLYGGGVLFSVGGNLMCGKCWKTNHFSMLEQCVTCV
eukprot:972971_1